MYEIDKNVFGVFLAQQRKEKGLTQKMIAERLFVSDKAVSKWERGISIPDVSLLIPLAELLDVSVTELLEGKKLENSSKMDADQVEKLVKKAIILSEETPAECKKKKRKHLGIYLGCLMVSFLELGVIYRLNGNTGSLEQGYGLITMEILSIVFGAYFWCILKENLPNYYDEHAISVYSDGFFKMHLAGIRLNNSNWPYIVKVGRIWTAVSLLVFPWFFFLVSRIPKVEWIFGIQMILLFLYLGGLFVPIWIVGQKYGGDREERGKRRSGKGIFFVILVVSMVLFFVFQMGGSSVRSAVRIGYVGHESRTEWTARYHSLSGTMSKKLYPKSGGEPYTIKMETKSGDISIKITDQEGNTIFSKKEMQSGTDHIVLNHVSRVKITADGHSGSFEIY